MCRSEQGGGTTGTHRLGECWWAVGNRSRLTRAVDRGRGLKTIVVEKRNLDETMVPYLWPVHVQKGITLAQCPIYD